jgi:hypothetical protein
MYIKNPNAFAVVKGYSVYFDFIVFRLFVLIVSFLAAYSKHSFRNKNVIKKINKTTTKKNVHFYIDAVQNVVVVQTGIFRGRDKQK